MRPRLVGAALAALAVLLMATIAVSAHAELVSSDPEDGATRDSPLTVTATFDEELAAEGSSLVVENSAGAQVAAGGVSPDDASVMTAEVPAVPDGVYTVRWTGVTDDDQAVERGTFSFTVGPPIPASSSPSATPQPTPSVPTDATTSDLAIVFIPTLIIIALVIGYLVYRNRR